jgi:hypothetical protein
MMSPPKVSRSTIAANTLTHLGRANPTTFTEAFAALVGETPGRHRNRQQPLQRAPGRSHAV